MVVHFTNTYGKYAQVCDGRGGECKARLHFHEGESTTYWWKHMGDTTYCLCGPCILVVQERTNEARFIYIYIYIYTYIYSTVGVPYSYPLCDLLRRRIGQDGVCMCIEATRGDPRMSYELKWHENAFAMMLSEPVQQGNKRARS